MKAIDYNSLTYQHNDELELFVLLLVLIFCFFIKDGKVDWAQEDPQVCTGRTWQVVLNLGQLGLKM